jgi:hypothetical protein
MHGVPDLDDDERIDMKYEFDSGSIARVIERPRADDFNLYVFQATNHQFKSYDLGPEFENPESARMYCDVYALTRFREEKTGRRGIPENVEQYGHEAVIAYQRCRSGVDAQWLANKYDLTNQRIYEYCSRMRSQAREKYDLVVEPDS